MPSNQVCRVFIVVVLLSAVAGAGEGPLKVVVDNRNVSITNGDQLVLRYRYADVPFKPYVDELRTPNGVNILRDAPHDHLHHHGLMFAVTVDGVNFWEEKKVSGSQKHVPFTNVGVGRSMGLDYASFVERIDWINPAKGKVLLHEDRNISVRYHKDLELTIVYWWSRLTLPEGKRSAEVTGANYFGLGARFLQSMDPTAKFFNADGKNGVDGTNAVESKWCAMTASVDGKDVTFVMFGPPRPEPRPITWFTMTTPFAYLAATPALDQKPMKIHAGEPLTFCYVIGLWDGHVKPEEVAKFYKDWVCTAQTADLDMKVRK